MENLEKLFKIQCLHPFFTFAGFAGFADLPAAKEGQFADCRRQRKLPAKRHVYSCVFDKRPRTFTFSGSLQHQKISYQTPTHLLKNPIYVQDRMFITCSLHFYLVIFPRHTSPRHLLCTICVQYVYIFFKNPSERHLLCIRL